jgi:hypothetical protein
VQADDESYDFGALTSLARIELVPDAETSGFSLDGCGSPTFFLLSYFKSLVAPFSFATGLSLPGWSDTRCASLPTALRFLGDST